MKLKKELKKRKLIPGKKASRHMATVGAAFSVVLLTFIIVDLMFGAFA